TPNSFPIPDNVSPFFTVYCSVSLITRIWSGCIVVDFMLFISINSSTVMLCCLEIPHKVSPLCTSTSAAETLDTVTPAIRLPVTTVAANFFISHVPPSSFQTLSILTHYQYQYGYSNLTSLLQKFLD